MAEEQKEACSTLVVTTPVGSLRTRGKLVSEIIAIMSLTLLALYGYVLYEHKLDTVASGIRIAEAIRESAQAQRELARAQQEMTCILSIPPDRRLQEYMDPYSYCRRIQGIP